MLEDGSSAAAGPPKLDARCDDRELRRVQWCWRNASSGAGYVVRPALAIRSQKRCSRYSAMESWRCSSSSSQSDSGMWMGGLDDTAALGRPDVRLGERIFIESSRIGPTATHRGDRGGSGSRARAGGVEGRAVDAVGEGRVP